MKSSNETKLKILIIGLTLVLGLVGLWVVVLKPDELPDARKILKQVGPFVPTKPKPVRCQLDVIRQEVAIPGNIIHAKNAEGVEVLTYKCKPADAAIALFTLRKISDGVDVYPTIVSARDSKGQDYLATMEPGAGSVKLLTLKRGFAVKPKSVNVSLLYGEVLQITQIAEPKRNLTPPQGKELVEAEKVARADIHTDQGYIAILCREKPTRGQFDSPTIIDSAYLPMDGLYYGLPPAYLNNIDAVKVLIDRMKKNYAYSTLVYRNAQIIQAGGNNLLSLPVMQDVGTLEGHKVMLGNKVPAAVSNGSKLKSAGLGETLNFRWKPTERLPSGAPASRSQDVPVLEVEAVTPTVEDMGLRSLRIVIPGALLSGGAVNGLDRTVYPIHPSAVAKIHIIPELRFTIREMTTSRVSSKTVILPVHRRLQRPATTTPLSKR